MILALAILLIGCRCAEPPPERELVIPHYGEWDSLVRLSALGEVDAAKLIARDLTEGEAGAWDGEGGADGAQAVGGALGFLQIASSAEDLADGLPIAASGCGTCHVGAGVQPRADRAAWGHETAAAWAVWGLVFSRVEDPPGGGGAEAMRAAEAYNGSPDDPVVALLSDCHECHVRGLKPQDP